MKGPFFGPYHVLIFAIGMLLFSSTSRADELILKDGSRVTGQIIREDDKAIILKSSLGTALTYFVDDIQSIDRAPVVDEGSQADKLENEAVALIDDGKRKEGLNKMVEAIEKDPTPLRQMNYGSILFGDGVQAFKKGDKGNGLNAFKVSERQLNAAIKGFDSQKDKVYLSQCYFLLGEIYRHAYGDLVKAKVFYQKAVHQYEHPVAQAAIKEIDSGNIK